MEAVKRKVMVVNLIRPVTIFEAMKAGKSGMRATIKEVIPHQVSKDLNKEGIKNEYRFSVRHSF